MQAIVVNRHTENGCFADTKFVYFPTKDLVGNYKLEPILTQLSDRIPNIYISFYNTLLHYLGSQEQGFRAGAAWLCPPPAIFYLWSRSRFKIVTGALPNLAVYETLDNRLTRPLKFDFRLRIAILDTNHTKTRL